MLLYYDDGPGLSGPLKPVSPPQAPATAVPVTLSTLTPPTCKGKTVLSFVAHQDDDLLFMNPDHQNALHSGECLRTVYLTAGDNGLRSTYWLGRQKGAEAAYDAMEGHSSSLWVERNVSVGAHKYIKMASPRGDPNVTLIFVNLPDGNLTGSGFLRTHNESLAKLASGDIGSISTVDGQSSYSKDDLKNLLVRLMQFYGPDGIDTQMPINDGTIGVDHSDHTTTGQFTAAAYTIYAQSVPIKYYVGYPISGLPQNVDGQDLTDKTATLRAYARHDNLLCFSQADSSSGCPYGAWLMRQYTYTPGVPLIAAPPAPMTTDPTSSDGTTTPAG